MQSRTDLLAGLPWNFSGHSDSDIVVVVEIDLGSFGMAAALSIEFNPWYCDLGHLSSNPVSTRVGHVQRLIKFSCSVKKCLNVYMCRNNFIQQLYTELNVKTPTLYFIYSLPALRFESGLTWGACASSKQWRWTGCTMASNRALSRCESIPRLDQNPNYRLWLFQVPTFVDGQQKYWAFI